MVAEELSWPDSVLNKLLPLVYAYWLSKRSRLNKPLCRKYWPQVTSSDTNPRQVFRYRNTVVLLYTLLLRSTIAIVLYKCIFSMFILTLIYSPRRTRDKERYRLRKQQKRNDIDAFRKMQQLRREFATARDLLQLVLERELLREVQYLCLYLVCVLAGMVAKLCCNY